MLYNRYVFNKGEVFWPMWHWISNIIYLLEPYFRFPDVIRHTIDILLVAYILYRAILLIKETRAEQVLKGLAVLLIVTWLSHVLRLTTLYWILKNTATVGVIALLIVFQPELRRALEQIGRGKIFEKGVFTQNDSRDVSVVIGEITRAVQNLAKNKIGALIVIERKTGVNDVIETGVRIGGEVSQPLLENIFVPNTPLHDGAVIIRDDRIAAAGCFLPLTENPNLSKQLGTRHRAALGISENSDALAIIVSEETGIISVASDGKLTRYLDPKTLKEILGKAYGLQREQSRTFSLKKWRARHEKQQIK